MFIFGDFNVHHKEWLTYSDGTDRRGELCCNFSFSNNLTQMVKFLIRIPNRDNSHGLTLFWISFFLLMLAFVLQWLFPHWEILIMLLSHVHWLSYKLKTGLPFSLRSLGLFLGLWNGLHDHLRDVPWEYIFELTPSAASCKFCDVRTDVYIPRHKYQIKPHPSPWFSVACAAAIVYRNHFFQFVPKE